MILTLDNICKIQKAKIELNGITVIAGENNTGKSTVGKVLYCIFNSFYKINEQIRQERRWSIQETLNVLRIFFHEEPYAIERTANIISENMEKYINNVQLLIEDLPSLYLHNEKQTISPFCKNQFVEIANKIIEIAKISDELIFKKVLSRKLNAEFNGQINNIYSPNNDGCIELDIKGEVVKIDVSENDVIEISNTFSLNTEVVYIDDPFVIDEMISRFSSRCTFSDHKEDLLSKLLLSKNDSSVKNAIGEIIASNKISNILDKINTVCPGEVVSSTVRNFSYKKGSSDIMLNIKNISTGLKTFVILKTLILNGSLEENGTIVLDEPEIHLHPQWQLLFAELIVLIQKEFNMHILLNTHSPYFLNAIEVYCAKYEIADKCKYYMAENDGDKAEIIDVTSNIEKIYKKLAQPLQELENERYKV